MTRRIVALGLTGTVAVGCSSSSTSADFSTPTNDNASNFGGASGESSDVDPPPTAPSSNYRGSPLCRVSTTADGCMPDDTGTHHTSNKVACYTDPSNTDGDANVTDIQGCRLVRTDTNVVPECVTANLDGTDGKSCSTGEECAPGFDCVDGGSGWVCRRYCCTGTCDDQVTQSGGPTFCDVQELVDSAAVAPVCMPLKRCTLLDSSACAQNETCAVVSDSGDTGCVTVGPAQIGDFCEDTHCATGLTCLGAPGNRKCYELCRVSNSTCAREQICKTSTLFKDPAYGVCQN